MPCYRPLTGYRSKVVNESGKRGIVFNLREGFCDLVVQVPCGQCIGCRLERSRQWAIRCVHEASLYEDNCFVTLTYSDEHLPADGSLDKSEFQRFMKRLRKRFHDSIIRYYHCGEYGEQFGRPHYHVCLFNHDFPDKKLYKVLHGGNKLYTSEILAQLWPLGYSTIGEVTFESAAYVARYILKKITGKGASEHYEKVNPNTGEIFQVQPEYTTMSRRPGIGKPWLDKYLKDVFPSDFIVMRGKKMGVPKYYTSQYEIICPGEVKKIKTRRKLKAIRHSENNTRERLFVREFVQKRKLEKLPRTIEKEL